jgi:hypothetical protein
MRMGQATKQNTIATMDKDSAIVNARRFLDQKNIRYEECIGANSLQLDGRTKWGVFFAEKTTSGC